MRYHIRRMLGFALLPALSLLASLVLLPLISQRFGPGGWVALALGQSIGAMVSVVVSMAWPVVGGNMVARARSPKERRDVYRASVQSRLLVLLSLLVVLVPLTHFLAHQYPWATVLFMVGVSFNGLSASWYFAGLGRPALLVVNEGVVRIVGYLVALIGLAAGAALLWYAAVTAVAGLVTFTLNWFTVLGCSRPYRRGDARLARFLVRGQLSGAGSQVLLAVFAYSGPTIFSLLAPSHLPLFSALDQIQKSGNNALNVLPNSFVSWVGSATPEQRPRRARLSVAFLVSVAVAIVPGWLLLGPSVLGLLFADHLSVGTGGDVLLSATIASELLCVGVAILVLVPAGLEKLLYASGAVYAVVGLVLTAAGALLIGAYGGLVAWLVVNAALLGYFALVRRRSAPVQVEVDPLAAQHPA